MGLPYLREMSQSRETPPCLLVFNPIALRKAKTPLSLLEICVWAVTLKLNELGFSKEDCIQRKGNISCTYNLAEDSLETSSCIFFKR